MTDFQKNLLKELDIKEGDKFLVYRIRTKKSTVAKGAISYQVSKSISRLSPYEIIGITKKIEKDSLEELSKKEKFV